MKKKNSDEEPFFIEKVMDTRFRAWLILAPDDYVELGTFLNRKIAEDYCMKVVMTIVNYIRPRRNVVRWIRYSEPSNS